MSTRVGLALARDAIRAVAARRDRIVWAGEAPMDSERPLAEHIGALLGEAPLPRWPRPLVSVAVGPHGSQVKLIAGLPDVADPDTLAAVVRESAASFFLKNGVPLITTGVRPAGAGSALAAAIDRPIIEAIRDACRAQSLRLGGIAPAAVVLPWAVEDARFTWTDGGIVLDITRTGPALDAVRTCPACAAGVSIDPARPVPALASIGERAVRFADAYGAALLHVGEPLALNALPADLMSPWEVWRPFVTPGLVLAFGLGALVLSPLASSWAGKRAEDRIARVRPGQWQVIQSARGQLDRVTAILADVRAFADSRSSAARLLGDVARALPPGTVVNTFDLDGDRGQVVMLSREPTVAFTAIQRIPSLASVELVSPVTSQNGPAGEPQQVTVRFRTRGAP